MRQYIETIKDYFVDFSGKRHYFVIVAISEQLGNTIEIYDNNEHKFTNKLRKGVRLGVSICHPDDSFDESTGTSKATYRAKSNPISLYATEGGKINTTLVQAFLKQEAEYLKNTPNKFINGYADAERKWKKDKEMIEFEKSLSKEEKVVVEKAQENPGFIDNIKDYLKWLLKKAKCRE